MRPPEDHEVDCRNPLSVAMWTEALARIWEREADNSRPDGAAFAYADGLACAYGRVARLMVGLPDGATLKEIRNEIYASLGVVPWEDPEAAERVTMAERGRSPRIPDAEGLWGRIRETEKPAVADTCDICGQRHEPGEDPECDDGEEAGPAVPRDSDEFDAERVPGEGLRR